MNIIEFVGVPGSGKTTISNNVADKLSSRGITVAEPIYDINTNPPILRVLSKARFLFTMFIRDTGTVLAISRVVIGTGQQTKTDQIRVLFNLLYVFGVVTKYRYNHRITLLDQGPYQGVWSVGFRSSHEWTGVLERFSKPLQIANPDLIVFVEADEKTISDRLNERMGGDTRFEPGSNDFDRGIEGYEQIKSYVLSAEYGPRSIVVENETRDTLQSSAIRVTDEILALDDQD